MIQERPVVSNFHKHVQNKRHIAWTQKWMKILITATGQSFLQTHKPSGWSFLILRSILQLFNGFLIISLRKALISLASIGQGSLNIFMYLTKSCKQQVLSFQHIEHILENDWKQDLSTGWPYIIMLLYIVLVVHECLHYYLSFNKVINIYLSNVTTRTEDHGCSSFYTHLSPQQQVLQQNNKISTHYQTELSASNHWLLTPTCDWNRVPRTWSGTPSRREQKHV